MRRDPLLGPIFAAKVGDWDAHAARVANFWSSVVLRSGRYKGNPFAAHFPIRAEVDTGHFQRWLELWGMSARSQFTPAIADMLVMRAGRIGESLKAGLLFRLSDMTESAAEAASPP